MTQGGDMSRRIIEVRIEWGDTLWDLSRRLGLDHWGEIQAANGLEDDLIFAGEVLKVPLPSSVSMTGCKWRRRHSRPLLVEPGDTAWDISERFGISLEDLERANSCILDLLYPGEVVQVPERDTTLKEGKARLKRSRDCGDKPRFFDVFPAKKDIDEYREKHRVLLNALRDVESSFIMPAPKGDGGWSIGPLQISLDYHTDAWWLATHGVKYEYCEDVDYSERTVINYWLRYCPWALAFGDFETLARTHNGGPQFWYYLSTTRYWNRVRRSMRRFGHRKAFPVSTTSIDYRKTVHLFSSHIIPFSIPLFDSNISSPTIMTRSKVIDTGTECGGQ